MLPSVHFHPSGFYKNFLIEVKIKKKCLNKLIKKTFSIRSINISDFCANFYLYICLTFIYVMHI